MDGEVPDINSNFVSQSQKVSTDKEETKTSKNSKSLIISEQDEEVSHSSTIDLIGNENEIQDVENGQDFDFTSSEPNINLSRDELLKLLSVFEGELQARDEVIAILKSECTQNPDKRYGLTSRPLKALQRDAALLEMTSQDHVCEQTNEQLQKIIQHHKQSYKKLKQMHLASEEKYQRLSSEVEEEKRKHQEFVIKSEDFVNLLEHDRERLKQILDQETSSYGRKELEFVRKIKENKEEIARIKSLSIELVEDRQRQLQNLSEQKQLTAALEMKVEELQLKVKESESEISTEKEHALQLENELEEQTNNHYQEYERLNTELTEEKTRTKELEEKVKSLGRQMQKLKCVDKDLRKTDDQLWRIKEKLEQEEKYDDLLEEVELLRKTVTAMQEAEQIYTQAHEECKELRGELEKELLQTKGLREEVERLRKNSKNHTDSERCVEEALFRFEEIQQLYEAEYKKQNHMKKQLEDFRNQLLKIDETEALLKFNEIKIKQLQNAIRELKEEKSGLETKLNVEKDKSSQYKDMIDEERSKVTEFTQKAIEESKKVLKAKEQLATLETKLVEETKMLHTKIKTAEETISNMITREKANQMEILINNLRKQVAMLKKRLDQLENEYERKEEDVRTAKEEAEVAKKNLNVSTEQLKRLVILGLGEQIHASQSDKPLKKISTSDTSNTNLEKDIKTLELRLRQSNNSNNICLKGVAVSDNSTQTNEKEEGVEARSSSARRLSRTNSSSETRPPSMRRVSSSTERPKAPFKAGASPTKRVSTSLTSRSSSCTRSEIRAASSTQNTELASVRLKATYKPVSVSRSSDSVARTASSFCTTVRNSKSEISAAEAKKEISDKTTRFSSDPSKNNVTTSSTKTSLKDNQSKPSKVLIKRNSSKKLQSSVADRKSSSSPTQIPKPGGGAASSPVSSQTTRVKISR